MIGFSCEATTLTPSVHFDNDRRLHIEGECYPENPAHFFTPIAAAIRNACADQASRPIEVRCRLTYVNSASLAWFRRILVWMDRQAQRGDDLRLVWEYEEGDDTALETAHDLISGLGRIELVEKPLMAPAEL